MDEILKDQRFAHIATDPRYKKIPKAHRKVKIDKRFESIFSDKKFQVVYKVDKRGRPVNQSSSENFRKYYDLSSDDEDESEDEDVDDKSKNRVSKTNKKVNKVKNKNSLSLTNKESSKISKGKNLDALVASGSSGEDDSEKDEIINEDLNDKEDNSSSESNDTEDEELKNEISSSQLDSIKIRSKLPDEVKEKLHDSNIDYARGMGKLMSDSSSDDESSSESDGGESDLEHDWGELDKDAETTDTATSRLAICKMDWDRIRAVDLMVLCSSFLPSKGHIKSVTIYPSEFGMKRMKEEELKGPTELVDRENKIDLKKNKPNNTVFDDNDEDDNKDDAHDDQNDDDDDDNKDDAHDDQNDDGDIDDEDGEESKEGSKYHIERLRQYQLNRLKYYYAVVVCDSAETASKLYSECDGLEYESSATKLDLRFIPDDVTFDQEPKEVCTEIEDVKKYEPRFFVNTALQQGKVTCTWDETDPSRTELAEKLQQVKGEDDVNEEDLRVFLASSSEDEDDVAKNDGGSDNSSKENGDASSDNDDGSGDDDGEKVSCGTNKSIEKYRNLLNKIQEDEEKKKDRDVQMEITWGVGLKEKTQSLVDKKLKKNEELTPFEQMIEKKKEKRKLRKEERKKNQNTIKNSVDSEEEEKEEGNEDNAFSDDDIPDDIDLNDDYFKEELGDKPLKKNKNKSKNKKKYTNDDEMDSDEKQKQDELALLLMDDEDKDGNKKSHFSLEKIQKMEENQGKKKRKGRKQIKGKNKKEEPVIEDDFEIDLNDDRFSAVFSQPQFNIDPSDSHYRKTKAMDALIKEKMSRKYKRSNDEVYGKSEVSPKPSKVQKLDSDLSSMISSIKKKTKGVK